MVKKKAEEKESVYFLATHCRNIRDYSNKDGFEIERALDGPEIPEVVVGGEYFIIKIERKFKVEPVTTFTTKELTVAAH